MAVGVANNVNPFSVQKSGFTSAPAGIVLCAADVLVTPGKPTLVSADTQGEDTWEIFVNTFVTSAHYAIAAAFSPNPDNPPYYVDIPVTYTDGTAALDEDLWAQWKERSLISQIERDGANLSDTAVFLDQGVVGRP